MSIFSKIKLKKPRRTVHNMSYSSQMSLPMGKLVPIMCEKVYPGDRFVHSHEYLLRFAPFVGQVFQSFKVVTDYFFVPSRLLWDNFERFLVDNDNLYPHPNFAAEDIWKGDTNMTSTLVDYFNFPTVNPTNSSPFFAPIKPPADTSYDCLPFAAYLKIFMDYYLDENLGGLEELEDDFLTVFESNGHSYGQLLLKLYESVNNSSDFHDRLNPFFKAYPKDYFTSALPFAQRGPLVQIPLNGTGDVIVRGPSPYNGDEIKYQGIGMKYDLSESTVSGDPVDVTLFPTGDLGVSPSSSGALTPDPESITGYGVFGKVTGSTSQNAAANSVQLRSQNNPLTFKAVNVNGTATINDLRTALTVQQWLETNARAGVRYKEQLAAHFGVRSKDYRLDRAELLQRSKSTVSIGEVFTTAANEDGSFVPGMGVSTATGASAVGRFKHSFPEHGYVIGLMCIYPVQSYHQGVPRQFMELDKFDYYWPEFQHIGEQEIFNEELFVTDDPAVNRATFGYTPRRAHDKSRVNQVHGDFRTTLPFMTDGRRFLNGPSLNMDFINIDPEKNGLYRVFNFTEPFEGSSPIFCDIYHNFRPVRPMDYFGIPRII